MSGVRSVPAAPPGLGDRRRIVNPIALGAWRRAAFAAVALALAILLGIAVAGVVAAAPQQGPDHGRAAILDRFPPESIWSDATPSQALATSTDEAASAAR